MASNFFNKASLVMVPDAPIDGKLPSVKPEDRSGDFTFSRGSNLAATRVNKDGLIEKGRENLVLQSNQFDTGWNDINVSVTSGQSGYDGSNDAWLLSKSAASGHITRNTTLSGINTFSVYAKAGTNTHLAFWIRNANKGKFFNLVNGTIGSDFINTPIDAKIEAVGGGWYRCSVTTDDATNNCRIYPADADGDVTGISGSIYIQDAQLEQGLVATEYIETTTAAVQKGILENLPRLDYSGGALCPSLLLEPQRSNILAYSEGMFDSSNFNQINGIAVTGQQTDLNGTNTAVKFSNFVQSSARLDYNTVVAAVDGKTYTYSAYYKGSGDIRINVSTSTGVGGAGEKTITLTDEWVRHSITTTFSSPTGNVKSHLAITRTANNDAEVYMCFAQIEEGGYPTSYIPTYGTSQTRSGDNTGTIDVSSLGVTTGYTLFYELGDFNVALGGVWLAQSGGNDRPYQVFGATAVIKTTSGDVYPFNHGTSGKGTGIKVAVNYDGTNINVFTNGTKRGTWAANKTLWDSLTDLDMNLSSVQMVNWKQLLVFPTALTDDECIALTTI